jgi:mRNA deadenylase 3'-5' endonuclease subunit Ccr4
MHSPCPDRKARYRALHYNVLVEWIGWGSGGILEGPVYKRREPLSNIVLGYAPDFICFCEVFERWSANLPELFGDKYSFICLDRADNNASNRTPLAYDRKKFRLIEGDYENLYSNQHINHRVMTWGLLEERETGKRILVCGTHWDSSGREDDRQKEAKACANLINQKTEQYGVEVILMGDFNTRKNFQAYDDLVTSCSMVDAESDEVSKISVDHIFVSKQIKVASCTRESGKSGQYASDHPPVICDFDI